MSRARWLLPFVLTLLTLAPRSSPAAAASAATAQTALSDVNSASEEAQRAIGRFRIPPGWKVELIAAEPDLANPVAFTFDEKERIYVVETFRHSDGVLDIRGRANWPSPGFKKDLSPERRAGLAEEVLQADLACRTVGDRERMLRYYFAENAPSLEKYSDRISRLERAPDGHVTGSTVFADGFHSLVDGLAAGILVRGPAVWFTDIPSLWHLEDRNDDGIADDRTSLLEGFGVRVGFLGHDLHGLRFGPDGRIYFSIGDRGANVINREGRRVASTETGAVFRCDPEGSNLEVFATGLRNPQELAFDAFGNLWTGDNNSDGGDQARWTYIVQDADCGWRVGYQYLESPYRRGPWNSERMWDPEQAAKIAFMTPAIANIGAGPSGVTYAAGTGLPEALNGHFFMVDFRGGPSGIWDISVTPKGAGFALDSRSELLWNALPTDVELGPDGGLYWTDWVQGWNKTGRGRIYRLVPPEATSLPIAAETRRLLRANLAAFNPDELGRLLGHADGRVRLRAQFALADRADIRVLVEAARGATNRFARFHGIWGLGQVARKQPAILENVIPLLADADPEVRAQSARILGEARCEQAGEALEHLLRDPEPRPRFFAAMAMGRLHRTGAGPAIVEMLRANQDQDPFLRHAGVMGLLGTRSPGQIRDLGRDESVAVRLAAVVALRRLGSPYLEGFLEDPDPGVVLEAARAIHDLPVTEALPRLASLIHSPSTSEPLLRRVINANLRGGTKANAMALAEFAASDTAPDNARAEALRALAHFSAPIRRDPVTGLWRPLPAGDAASARSALASHFRDLTAGAEIVAAEAVAAAGDLSLEERIPELEALARDTNAVPRVRVAALQALGTLKDAGLRDIVKLLTDDAAARVRREALRWQGRLGGSEALQQIRSALESDDVAAQQVAMTSLGTLRGTSADDLLVSWLRRAARGSIAPELQLEVLEAGRSRRSGPAREALERFQSSLASTNPVTAHRYVLRGGDAAAGRKIFFEKLEVQCVRCHKAGGDGGIVGPDLGDVGSRQPREYLLQSILQPNAVVAPGFENLTVELTDGRDLSGTVQKETPSDLVLATVDQGVVTLAKADIKERWKGLSAMPEGLGDILSPRELRDLIEFLADLKGTAGQ